MGDDEARDRLRFNEFEKDTQFVLVEIRFRLELGLIRSCRLLRRTSLGLPFRAVLFRRGTNLGIGVIKLSA